MTERKMTDLPLLVTDMVETPPTKITGNRRIIDLDVLSDIPNDAEIVVQKGSKTFRTTKQSFVSSLRLEDTSWDDLKFPASATNIDSASTRYSFDQTELGISFDADARYPNEQVSMIAQFPHTWKEGSTVRPHIHWIQSQANIPNFLLAYRSYNNGDTPGAFTFVEPDNHLFTYTSGDITQISGFPNIDMSGLTLSCMVDLKLWVDTANTSTFITGGAQALGGLLKEFDIHYEIDSFGSNGEFTKDTG